MQILPEMVEYAKQLKANCKKTNTDLAEETFMSVSNVQRYINGDVGNADPEAYRRLILALGGDLSMVLGNQPPAAPAPDYLATLDARHTAELSRLSKTYEDRIASQDKWLRRLALVVAVLMAVSLFLAAWSFNLDSRIHDYGIIQYDASDVS